MLACASLTLADQFMQTWVKNLDTGEYVCLDDAEGDAASLLRAPVRRGSLIE